jgi:hypothetical protein
MSNVAQQSTDFEVIDAPLVLPLYALGEFNQAYVDAVVINSLGELLLISVYARQTIMQQIISALTLSPNSGGAASLQVVDLEGHLVRRIHIGARDQLTKKSAKLPVLASGEIVHTWIYDQRLAQDDLTNGVGYVVLDASLEEEQRQVAIWQKIVHLAPIPLRDVWQEPVMRWLGDVVVHRLDADADTAPLGNLWVARIELGEGFAETIAELLKRGELLVDDLA